MSSPGLRLLRGNVLWLSVVSLLNDAASEMIYPLLPLFIVGTLGAGPAVLGLIEGVAESTSSFVKLGGGWLSDRVGRRKPWITGGYGVAAIARPLLALAAAPWHVLAIRFGDRLGKGVRTAPRDALLAESSPPSRRGLAFGIHRAADHAGAVTGPLLATAFLAWRPGDLRTLFALALIPGALALAVVLLRVREGPAPAPAPASAPASNPDPDPGSPDPDPGFYRFLGVLALFTLGNASDAFLLLRAQQLGVDIALLPMLWAAHHVSKMVWSTPGGALADRFGPRLAILVGWTVYGATYLGFAMADAAWHAWALFLVYGLFYGLTEAPEKAFVASFSAVRGRGYAFGAYHFAIGIAALPASLLFGWIWQARGAPAAFVVGGALGLAAAVLLLLFVPRAVGDGAAPESTRA
ncbi:MAG: MFS transporter [Longimicrobiales bacterium]